MHGPLWPFLGNSVPKVGHYFLLLWLHFHLVSDISSSDASELGSAQFSSDSARAGGFSARLGSARAIFEPARLAKFGLVRAKIDLLIMKPKKYKHYHYSQFKL